MHTEGLSRAVANQTATAATNIDTAGQAIAGGRRSRTPGARFKAGVLLSQIREEGCHFRLL